MTVKCHCITEINYYINVTQGFRPICLNLTKYDSEYRKAQTKKLVKRQSNILYSNSSFITIYLDDELFLRYD